MFRERQEMRDGIATEPVSVIAIIRRITGFLIKSLGRISQKHIENRNFKTNLYSSLSCRKIIR